LEWKDVLPLVLAQLGNESSSISCVLEFLKILPEEVTEGRKFNLSVRVVSTPLPLLSLSAASTTSPKLIRV
jgi:hypothetical protein